MRAIAKQGSGGFHLSQANLTPPQTAVEARTRWHSFSHKNTVLDNLLIEQYYLCCYSEVRLDLLGLGQHIEHVRPKSGFPLETFLYENLAACALSSDDLQNVAASDVFGGHAKGANYDAALFISCHQPDCGRFFAYLSDGRIVPSLSLNPAEAAQASYTIGLLNLNSPFLIVQRQRWWSELDSLYSEHEEKGWSLEHLAAIDLLPTTGRLGPFFSITRQFFEEVAENVLTGA